jgi:hypothetical protein
MLMFAVSLILMVLALALSIVEIGMSVGALNVHLSDMEQALASDDKPVQGWSWLWRRLGRVSLTSLVWLSVVLALLILWLRDHWELQRLKDGPTVGGASWSIQQTISPPQGMIAVKQLAGRSQDLADNEELEEGPNDESSASIDGRRRGFGVGDPIRGGSSFSSVST